ncbi:MAG: LysE family translocator [Haliscomenobacteraceae bacterium CHB4]|nr:LysE family translocator [Haliscomenobacteraceae bacterium CHB4]
MIDYQNFVLFAFASLMLNITPGQDMMYVASRSVGQGIKAGIMSALGVCAGCMVHIAASVFGISAVLAQSSVAFNIIKWAGAIYLVYIGVQAFRSEGGQFQLKSEVSETPIRTLFRQGFVTNVLNPKVAIFFLAFLPQFVQAEQGNVPAQMLLLGLWFDFSGLVVLVLVALLFGRLGNWLLRYPGFVRWQEKITGTVLLYLGLRLAFLEKR